MLVSMIFNLLDREIILNIEINLPFVNDSVEENCPGKFGFAADDFRENPKGNIYEFFQLYLSTAQHQKKKLLLLFSI
jgi:hypothetical protein